MIRQIGLRALLLVCSALAMSNANAAINCNMTTASVGVLYVAGVSTDTLGSVTITCSRNPSTDPASITYRIKADNGANFSTNRRVRLGVTTNYLTYFLRRGTVVGGAAACGNSSTWAAPATGTFNVITGTLAFATGASSASALWGYCVRVRGSVAPNPAAPTQGIYVDNVQVTGQYPNSDVGALTPSVPLTYTIGVNSQCVFNTFPTTMNFNYTSFSPTAQTLTQLFDLRCSTGLSWALTVSPPLAPLLGLNYNMSIGLNSNPALSSGAGTGADQVIRITGTIPANQAGTCSASSCTATQGHTVTITY